MNGPTLSNSSPEPADVVRELHGMLNWLLLAGAFLIYAVISRILLAVPVVFAVFAEESLDWANIFALAGILLMVAAVVPPAWGMITTIAALLKLRSSMPLEGAFARLRVMWQGIFAGTVLTGAGYLLSLPVGRQVHQEEIVHHSSWQQYMDNVERRTQEEKEHAKYIRKLEEDYHRKRKERDQEEKP